MSYELVGRDCTKIKLAKQGCFCLGNQASEKDLQFPLHSMFDFFIFMDKKIDFLYIVMFGLKR